MGKTLIRVECIDQRLILTSAPAIASGGRNEDEIEFSFCSLWAGYAKTAVFFRDKNAVYHVPVTDDKCVIPHEVLASEGVMYLGVFGVSGDIRRTSDTLRYYVEQGAITESGLPSDPNSDIYKKYLDNLAEMEQATRAANTAASAANTATASANTATASAKTAAASANTAAAAANEATRLAPKPLALTQEGQPAQIWPDVDSLLRPTVSMLPMQSGSGDPSPTNVRPISGRTSVVVARFGRNLLDVTAKPTEIGSGVTAAVIDGGVRITSNNSANQYVYARWRTDIPIESADMIGRTFTLSCKAAPSGGNTPQVRITVHDKNGKSVGQVKDWTGSGDVSLSYTISANEVGAGNRLYVTLYGFPSTESHAAGTYTDYTNVQLEAGAASAYESYRGNTYDISLGRTVYGGVLNVQYGVLTITRAMVTLNGSEAWQAQDTGKGYRMKIDISDIVKAASNSANADIICSDYKTITANQSWNGGAYGVSQQQNWTEVFFNDAVYAASGDVAAWKAYLAGHPVQLCYMLAEPIVVQIDPTAIPALGGLNTVLSSGDSMELTYNKSLVREHEELLARIAALEAAVVANA